jgi:predicted RNA-binding Zn-ribbon protein involved in translation (DUF1610 family)
MAAWRAAESDEERRARLDSVKASYHAVRLAEARFCTVCKVSISHRSRRAVYCEQCAAEVIRASKKDRYLARREAA